MSYSILIVEDEKEKARGIAYLIERYNPECMPILLAHDGREGLETARKEKPDIILTDIKMPVMDGLEMIRLLVEEECAAAFIVLSGYAEFAYAKRAMELGVRDFITKPVDEQELCGCLNKVCREILERRASADSLSQLNDDVYNYAFRDFLTGGEEGHRRACEYLKNVGMLDGTTYFTCMVVEAEEDLDWKEGRIEDGCPEEFFYRVKTGGSQAVIVAWKRTLDKEVKRNLWQRMLPLGENHRRFSIGIGNTYEDHQELPKAYEEACVALNYRILKGSGKAILFEELCGMENHNDLLTEEEIEQLKERVDRLDQKGFGVAVRGILRRVMAQNALSLPELQKLSLNIVLIGLHNIPTAQLRMNEYFGKNLFTLKSIEKFRTMEQLENWILNMVGGVNEVMLKDNIPKKKDVVLEAKEYIRQNYNKNITLNDISERFYINPYYFSQLFKKKTGTTYQKYLTDYRVDRARKLLEETDLRIYEVCKLVGYSDVNHFNQVFERSEGCKPSEYRQRHRSKESSNEF